MTHDEAAARIANICGFLVRDAISARLAIRVARQLGASAAVAMQLTARHLADDLTKRYISRKPGRKSALQIAQKLKALADAPSDELPVPNGELRSDLKELA